jgi:hypothetical protein
MTRPLTVISIIGILTALVCLPLAASLYHGQDSWSWLPHFNWSGSDYDDDDGDESSAPNRDQIASRNYDWTSDRLELDVPANVSFTPSPEWHLTIRGPERALERLKVEDGRIDIRHHHARAGKLQIELSGPALRHVVVNGTGSLVLDGLQQDSLDIDIHGSGSARASGAVDSVKVNIMGSGSAQLQKLIVSRAKIFIAGSGDVDVTPRDDVDVFIGGAGDVRLHTHPKHVSSRIAGSGRVEEVPENPVT